MLKKHRTCLSPLAVLAILCCLILPPVWATDDTPPQVTQREGESDAAYQARQRAAERAWASAQARGNNPNTIELERRRGESDASYQARKQAIERDTRSALSLVKLERRRGESDTSYFARMRAAARAQKAEKPSLLEKQPESDAIYQARLKMTINGLLSLLVPEPTIERRKGESDASYGARCRATERASMSQAQYLIARPGENEASYQSRLMAWKDPKTSVSLERRGGESEASYQARLRAAERARKTDLARDKEGDSSQ